MSDKRNFYTNYLWDDYIAICNFHGEIVLNLIIDFTLGFLQFVKEYWITVVLVSTIFIIFDIIDLKKREHKSVREHRVMLFWLFVQYNVITVVFGYFLVLIGKTFHFIAG